MMKIKDLKDWFVFIKKYKFIGIVLIVLIFSVSFIVIPYVSTFFSEKAKHTAIPKNLPDNPVEKNIEQSIQGNKNTQTATTGDNSPITNIGEQKIYVISEGASSFQSPEMIEIFKQKSLWSIIHGRKGDRRAYSRLLLWQKTPKNLETKDLLDSAIEDVKSSYAVNVMRLNIEPVRDQKHWWICKVRPHPTARDCSAGWEESENFNIQNVISHLSMKYWQERGRAASMLRNIGKMDSKNEINKEELFQKLIDLLDYDKEKSLFVAMIAFETYKDLTGFNPKSKHVFAFESAIKHWEENKEKIKNKNF